MAPTRRGFVGLSLIALTGCLTNPGRSCPGATVRLSLRPTTEPPSVQFDRSALSAEAIVVLETAIEDEHVERCVSWEPAPNETGPSPGLNAIADRIQTETDIELSTRTEPIEVDVRFDGADYRLLLTIERSA